MASRRGQILVVAGGFLGGTFSSSGRRFSVLLTGVATGLGGRGGGVCFRCSAGTTREPITTEGVIVAC